MDAVQPSVRAVSAKVPVARICSVKENVRSLLRVEVAEQIG